LCQSEVVKIKSLVCQYFFKTYFHNNRLLESHVSSTNQSSLTILSDTYTEHFFIYVFLDKNRILRNTCICYQNIILPYSKKIFLWTLLFQFYALIEEMVGWGKKCALEWINITWIVNSLILYFLEIIKQNCTFHKIEPLETLFDIRPVLLAMETKDILMYTKLY